MITDLGAIQQEVKEWTERNFDTSDPHHPILGAVEELGELCHAVLKGEQGIRGGPDAVAEKDAVVDTIIYLMDFCNRRGYDLARELDATWKKVRSRDWQSNPTTGELHGEE